MIRRMFLLTLPAVLLAALPGQSKTAADWYTKAVKGVSAAFEPAEARPGQTVLFKLTVELNDGYYTYPLMQAEKAAANYVNKLEFPGPGEVIFVGPAADPAKLPTKPEPDLGIAAMRYCPGGVTYTRPAVVSPKAAAGVVKVAVPGLKLSICDATNCYPAKAVPTEATLMVLGGPPLPVAKEYAAEVEKALAGK